MVELPRRSDEDGLITPGWGTRPLPVRCVLTLALDAVSVLLSPPRSGVDEVVSTCVYDADGELFVDEMEESEPSDAAEVIASGCAHVSTERLGASDGIR